MLRQVLLHACRSARSSRLEFCLSAALLALGASACVIAVDTARGLLWGDLPYEDPASLVFLYEASPNQSLDQGVPVSIPTFEDWRAYSSTFEGIARVAIRETPNVLLLGNPEHVQSHPMSSDLLNLLGVSPIIGRSFLPEEENSEGNNKVLLLSYRFWHEYFEADSNVVGRSIRLDDGNYTVVGVLPEGFTYPPFLSGRNQTDLWVPSISRPIEYTSRDERWQTVIGRLGPEIQIEQALRDLQEIASHIGQNHPITNGGWGVRISPIQRRFVERSKSTGVFPLLGFAVGGVLILSCANVVILLIARAVRRQPEAATLTALGIPQHALVFQHVAEGILIALSATVGGMAVAWAGLNYVDFLIPSNFPRVNVLSIRSETIALVATLTLILSLLCTSLPLFVLRRTRVHEQLQHIRQSPNRFESRMETIVISVQVSITIMLLALSVTAWTRLDGVLKDAEGSISVSDIVVVNPSAETRFKDDYSLKKFHTGILEQIRSIPGVKSAALVSELALSARRFRPPVPLTNRIGEQIDPLEETIAQARSIVVSPQYFETMGIPLLRGRDFDVQDSFDSQRVAILSHSLASNPSLDLQIGEQIRVLGDEWLTVVGTVGDAPLEFGHDEPILYVSDAQVGARQANAFPEYLVLNRDASVVLNTSLPLSTIAPSIRSAVWAIDKYQPIDVTSMTAVVSATTAVERLVANVFLCLALIASVLAGAGIFGVLTKSIHYRTREIGLRMSLGAQPIQVIHSVVRYVVKPSIAGVILGILLASVTQRVLLATVGIEHSIGVTEVFVSGMIVLFVVTISASIPTLRVVNLNPSEALRYR